MISVVSVMDLVLLNLSVIVTKMYLIVKANVVDLLNGIKNVLTFVMRLNQKVTAIVSVMY